VIDGTPQHASSPAPETGVTSGAGFWIRVLARFIDIVFGYGIAIFSGCLLGIAVFILQSSGVISSGCIHRFAKASIAQWGLHMFGGVLYHTVTEGIHGASLGKLVCRLRVIRADGRPSTVPRAFLRSLAFYFDSLVFGAIGYCSMRKSPLNQRYGDVWAKTVVVRTRCVPATAARPAWRFIIGFCLGVACWIFMATLGFLTALL